ncbi:MAG: VOC family protein [Marinilabiliaceae bacterium]|jgi:catechol 2,3-dioxygenase-like lactoylglutathione lyase family enzyme|nr:VOC family protein [Marinilabiliaceae bacterium]
MRSYVISGIQQMGVGVKNLHESWEWYRKFFGMDVPIFEEEAEAKLMLPYTGGEPRSRHAVLAMNLQSGGGFEIWQYKGREPKDPGKALLAGDLGIYACKMKVKNTEEALKHFKSIGAPIMGEAVEDPFGRKTFFIKDPYNNIFQFVQATDWFLNEKKVNGGSYGAVIGVTDIEKSMQVYSDILGYDHVLYDKTGTFDDLKCLPGGEGVFRRVLLSRKKPFNGPFRRIFGNSVIELLSAKDREPQKIFEDRYWGDPGFIHLCYDIGGMDYLKNKCEETGYAFTVDSKSSHDIKGFDMGEAAGHFAYIEDPDGTLIEFVETLKVPIIKKLGWYINLENRHPEKKMPNWVLKALRFSRVKDR